MEGHSAFVKHVKIINVFESLQMIIVTIFLHEKSIYKYNLLLYSQFTLSVQYVFFIINPVLYSLYYHIFLVWLCDFKALVNLVNKVHNPTYKQRKFIMKKVALIFSYKINAISLLILYRPGGHWCPLSLKFQFYLKKVSSKKFPMSVAPMSR